MHISIKSETCSNKWPMNTVAIWMKNQTKQRNKVQEEEEEEDTETVMRFLLNNSFLICTFIIHSWCDQDWAYWYDFKIKCLKMTTEQKDERMTIR